jgi:hypothetical protein
LDASRLSKGEQIVGGAGIVLFITSFVTLWSKYEGGGETERTSAWKSPEGFGSIYPFYTKLAVILALVAVVLVVIRALGTDLNLPLPLGLVYVGIGGLVSLFMLLTLLIGPKEIDFPGVEESRGIFLYLGVLLSLAMLYGGYMHMQSETSAPTPTEPPPPAA